ncbi:hypothetical protein [Sporosarcina sp. SAFN-015]|uniref:YqgU-like beta propeller domain-containing protein n=1 Tax=Sporosarcina sp. SAFN-015 TaxID=3387274 RepID=UPI003F7D5489
MKRMTGWLLLFLIMMFGCSEKSEPPAVEPNMEEPSDVVEESVESPTPQVFEADPSSFHFIADWLTDTQILYVVKNNGVYKVNYFDIETGETGLVYEDSSFIIDVLVHPSSDYLLVHTSDHPNSAVIKIVEMDGTVEHEVEIDSTELSIEWNRENPKKILFTAFHEDWSFDLFAFDGSDDSLSLVELDDPFPKWANDNKIFSMLLEDHPLDGGDIQMFHLDTEKVETTGIGNAVYFDVFDDAIGIVQTIDSDAFTYTIRNFDGEVKSEWKLPAVSNYSEWVVPAIEWLDENRLILKGAEKSGQLDELGAKFNLYRFEKGSPELLVKGLDEGPLKCSPSGQYCLNGYTSEELIDMRAKEIFEWIEFDN